MEWFFPLLILFVTVFTTISNAKKQEEARKKKQQAQQASRPTDSGPQSPPPAYPPPYPQPQAAPRPEYAPIQPTPVYPAPPPFSPDAPHLRPRPAPARRPKIRVQDASALPAEGASSEGPPARRDASDAYDVPGSTLYTTIPLHELQRAVVLKEVLDRPRSLNAWMPR